MTKITKSNVDAAMRDDAAHIDYLKRDVLDDQKYGGKYKDENQTADEKHISKLAGDIKHDMKDKSFIFNFTPHLYRVIGDIKWWESEISPEFQLSSPTCSQPPSTQ